MEDELNKFKEKNLQNNSSKNLEQNPPNKNFSMSSNLSSDNANGVNIKPNSNVLHSSTFNNSNLGHSNLNQKVNLSNSSSTFNSSNNLSSSINNTQRPLNNTQSPLNNNSNLLKDDKNVSYKENIPQNNYKGKKSKKFIILGVAISLIVLVGSLLFFLLRKDETTYTVSFENWVVEIEDKEIKSGNVFYAPTPENIYSITDSQQEILTFNGWVYEDGTKYTPKELTSDLVLYATYTSSDITTTFVIKDYYSGNQNKYIFLSSVTTTFFDANGVDDKISFDSVLEEKLFNFDDSQNINNVLYYDINNKIFENTQSSVSIESYKTFLNNYYSISNFTLLNNEEKIDFEINDTMNTPQGNMVVVVNLNPKEVELIFNSNFDSVKNEYGKDDFEDYSKSQSVVYGTDYEFFNFIDIFPNVDFNKLIPNHTFQGWSTISPIFDSDGNVTNIEEMENNLFINYQREVIDFNILNNGKELNLYAVWKTGETAVIIYNENNGVLYSTNIMVGSSNSLSNILGGDFSKFDKQGYSLIGFNTSRDLSGKIANKDTVILGGINSEYYNQVNGAIVLYAVYKKVYDTTTINLNSDSVDQISNLDESNLSSLLNVNLNIDGYVYENDIEFSYSQINNSIVITNLVEGATISLPQFDRSNYTLTGYYTNNLMYDAGSSFTISNPSPKIFNINIDTIWQGNDFVFAISSNDDSLTPTKEIQVEYGVEILFTYDYNFTDNFSNIIVSLFSNSLLISTVEIQKEGHTFVNFTDINSNILSNNSYFVVNSTFDEIFVNWQVCSYDVMFMLNGGTHTPTSASSVTYKVNYNDTINLKEISSNIDKQGSYLIGWSTDNDANVVYNYQYEDLIITNETTLYAVYKIAKKFIVYLDASRSNYVEVVADIEDYFVLTNDIFDGFSFNYYSSYESSSIDTLITASTQKRVYNYPNDVTEIYAIWYEINFENGLIDGQNIENSGIVGNPPQTSYVTNNITYAFPQSYYDDSNSYFNLSGWEFGREIYDINSSFEINEQLGAPNSLVVFTASWGYKDVLVQLYLDKSAQSPYIESYAVDFEDSRVFTISVENGRYPQNSSKVLDYFSSYDNAYFVDNDTITINIPYPNENMQKINGEFVYPLYANWKLKATFNANNGNGLDVATIDVGVDYDKTTYANGIVPISVLESIENKYSLTLPTCESLGFVKTHSDFSLWENVITKEQLSVGQEVVLQENQTFDAVWIGKNYTVNFVDSEGENQTVSKTFEYGLTYSLSDLFDLTNYNTEYENVATNRYKVVSNLRYSYGNTIKDFEFDDDVFFATFDSYSDGFISSQDLTDDNEINFEVVWTEKTYTLKIAFDNGLWDNNVGESYLLIGGRLYIENGQYYFNYQTRLSELDVGDDKNGKEIAYKGFYKLGYKFGGLSGDSRFINNIIGDNDNITNYYLKFSGSASDFDSLANEDDIIELTVIWNEVLTVDFNLNGGSLSEGIKLNSIQVGFDSNNGATIVLPELNSDDFSKAESVFAGLYFTNDTQELNREDAVLFNFGDSIVITSEILSKFGSSESRSIIIYFIWKATLTFNANTSYSVIGHFTKDSSEMIASTSTSFSQQFFCGEELTLNDLYSYYFVLDNIDSFEAKGWKTSSGDSTNLKNLIIDSNINLYANWIQKEVKISFKNFNGSDFNQSQIYFEEFSGARINLKDKFLKLSSFGLPTLEGYNFVGWATNFDNNLVSSKDELGEDVYYDFDQIFVIPNYETTLYAVFEKCLVTVTYIVNNENAQNVQNVVETDLRYGDTYYIREDIPFTVSYFDLLGFSLDDVNSQGILSKNIVLNIDNGLTKVVSGDIVSYELNLYAVWSRQTKRFVIELNGGSFNNSGKNNDLPTFFDLSGGKIKSFSVNKSNLTVEVYLGPEGEYGLTLPSNNYLFRDGYALSKYVVDGQSYVSGNTLSATTSTMQTLSVTWIQVIELRVYSNYNLDDEQYLSFSLNLDDTLTFDIVGKSIFNVSTQKTYQISFDKPHYELAYISASKNSGKNYQNKQYKVNDTEFVITNGIINLYCAWQGVNISVVIDACDNEENSLDTTVTTIENAFRYGDDFVISSVYSISQRKDGNEGYELDYFLDEFDNKYYANDVFNPELDNLDYKNSYEFNVVWKQKEFNVILDFGTGVYKSSTTTTSKLIYTCLYNEVFDLKLTDFLPENAYHADDAYDGRTYRLYDFYKFTSKTVSFDDNQTFVMPASDVTFSVNWVSKNINFVFDANNSYISDEVNGGSYQNSDLTSDYDVKLRNDKLVVMNFKIGDILDLSKLPSPIYEGFNFMYIYLQDYNGVGIFDTLSEQFYSYENTDTFTINEDIINSTLLTLDNLWNESENAFELHFTISWIVNKYTINYVAQLPMIANGYNYDASSTISSSSSNLQEMVYDQPATLRAGFSLYGWEQVGWTTVLNYKDIIPSGENKNAYYFSDGICENEYAYNFTSENNAEVKLYPIWEQKEFSLNLIDLQANNNIVDNDGEYNSKIISFLFDERVVIDDLFARNQISIKPYSFENNTYYVPTGIRYFYTENDSRVELDFTFEDYLVFALSPTGFINAKDLTDDNTIEFEIIWTEVYFDIYFDLNGGKYDENAFGLVCDIDDSGNYVLKGKVRYSSILSGVSTLEEFGLVEDKIIKEKNNLTYSFAGWALQESSENMYSLKGDMLTFSLSSPEESLKPDKNGNFDFVFVFVAMFNEYKISINIDNASIKESVEDTFVDENQNVWVVKRVENVGQEQGGVQIEKEEFYTYSYANNVFTILDTKFHKNRLVPFSDSVSEALTQYLERFPSESPDSLIFPSSNPRGNGARYGNSWLQTQFRQLLRMAGIPYNGPGKGPRLHDIRHTFAVHCLNKWVLSGEDLTAALPVLSRYLGHNGLTGTQKYLQLTAQMYPDIVAKLETQFGRLIPQMEVSDENI